MIIGVAGNRSRRLGEGVWDQRQLWRWLQWTARSTTLRRCSGDKWGSHGLNWTGEARGGSKRGGEESVVQQWSGEGQHLEARQEAVRCGTGGRRAWRYWGTKAWARVLD